MIWSFIQIFGRQAISFVFFTLLSLRLTPEEIGVVGIIIVISGLAQSFSELGFGASLIYKKEINRKYYSNVFFANVLVGMMLGIICLLYSEKISAIFSNDKISPLLRFLSIGFIVNSISLTHIAILQKQMKFKDLAKRDLYSGLFSVTAGVISLLYGAGVWSVIIQLNTYYIVGSLILLYHTDWRPKFSDFSVDILKELWPYSSRILATNMFNFGVKNIDRLLIGGALGMNALGIYTFAYNLIMIPIISINAAMGAYLFSKFSEIRNELAEVNSYYLKTMRLSFLLLTPLIISFSQNVYIIVDLIWGNAWREAIPIIQVLSALAIAGLLVAPCGQLMKSFGRPDWLLYWSMFTVSLSTILIFFGIKAMGLIGASLAMLISTLLSLPIILFIIKRLTGIGFTKIFKLLFPVAIASVHMIIIFLSSKIAGYDSMMSQGITTAIAIAVYISLVLILDISARNGVILFFTGENRFWLLRYFQNISK